jgi:hypothetical protein
MLERVQATVGQLPEKASPGARGRRVHLNPAPATRSSGDRPRRAARTHGDAATADAPQGQHARGSGRLPTTEGPPGTGVRPDQAGHGVQAVLDAWAGEARGEWGLVCMCHNVRRLHAARTRAARRADPSPAGLSTRSDGQGGTGTGRGRGRGRGGSRARAAPRPTRHGLLA